jgi:hypothetical protein
MYEKLGRAYSKCGYSGNEGNIWKNILLFMKL